MKSWSRRLRREEPDGEVGSSSSRRSSISAPPAAVWVSHSPPADGDSPSSSPPAGDEGRKESMKERLRSLVPQAWGDVLLKWTKPSDGFNGSESGSSRIQILPNGTRVSPPVSPLMERRFGGSLGNSSSSSHKALLRGDDELLDPPGEDSLLTSIHPAEDYALKLEVYNQKYSYLKSWPGLLRLLAGLQLLFGGMVFACIIAYIQKDSEWSSSYGLYNGAFNNGLGLSGYSYRGPMTPFILAVAGVSWIITFVLLVMGLTMYYRTILLDAPWWPLTEAFINVALFLLYMAAGIVYLNDLNRGGLCYTTIGVNPIMANLCRVDGGQMAGTAFIFINIALYLGSFLVCLKMWRHEASRRERSCLEMKPQEELHQSILLTPQKPKRISFKDEADQSVNKVHLHQKDLNPEVHRKLLSVSRTTESGSTPKDHVHQKDLNPEVHRKLLSVSRTTESGSTPKVHLHQKDLNPEVHRKPLSVSRTTESGSTPKVHLHQKDLNPEVHRKPLSVSRTTESGSTPKDHIHQKDLNPEVHRKPLSVSRTTESGSTPKVHVIADYILKYPEISCVEEKEKYRAVFNDQYQEYKDLHRDISTTLEKFREMDVLMARLLREGRSPEDQQRIQSILKTYRQKKSDPGLLEKRQRCDYLKAKLSHIKNRIRTFEQEEVENSET